METRQWPETYGIRFAPNSVAFRLYVFGSLGLGFGVCFSWGGNGLMIDANVS